MRAMVGGLGLWVAALAVAAGCDGGSGDGGRDPDGRVPQDAAKPDVVSSKPDARPDFSFVDAVPDAGGRDAELDGAPPPDGTPDAVSSDTGGPADASFDVVSPDVTATDAAARDSAPDSAPPDARPDTDVADVADALGTDAAPRCDDDEFEENDVAGRATTVVMAGGPSRVSARVCAGDSDWFVFEVPEAGCSVRASLEFAHADGNIDFSLIDANGVEVAVSRSLDDGESIDAPVGSAGIWYIRVALAEGTANAYDLAIDLHCAPEGPCPGDDPFEPNDAPSSAARVAEGPMAAVACAGNPDFYYFEAVADCTVDATVRVTGPADLAPELSFRLLDSESRAVRAVTAGPEPGRIVAGLGADGPWFFDVTLIRGGAATYTLDTALDCPPPCVEDPFEENDGAEAATALRLGAPFDGAICGDDADWYRVGVDDGCVLSGELRFDVAGGDLRFEIRDPAGFVLTDSRPEVSGRSVNARVDAAGEYFFVVGGANGAENTYRLIAHTECVACFDDAAEENDTAQSADVLASDTPIEARICPHDPDVWRFEAASGCVVDAILEFDAAVGDLDLELSTIDGELARSATDGSPERIELELDNQAEYLLTVRGGEGAENDYTLSYTLDCPDPVPECPRDDGREPNDDFRRGTPLAPNTPFEGIICGFGATDWFRIQLPDDACDVEATLTFIDDDGDLWLELVEPDGLVIADVDTPTDNEAMHAPALFGGDHALVVGLDNTNASGLYSLQWSSTCPDPPTCPANDAYEPNDSDATAVRLASDTIIRGVLCGGDVDVFEFELPRRGCIVDADLVFENARGDLSLELRDAEGDVVASSDDDDDDESLRKAFFEPGRVTLTIAGEAGADPTPYGFRHHTLCPEPAECPADDRLEPNDERGEATPLSAGSAASGVVCDDDIDLFAIEVPTAGCEVIADLAFVHDEGDLDLFLLDSTDRELGRATTETDDEQIRAQVVRAGQYFLQVDLFAGEGASNYVVSYRIVCSEALTCPANGPEDAEGGNNSLDSATPLIVGQPTHGIICEGDVDLFDIDVDDGCSLQADLVFRHADANLDLELLDALGNPLSASTTFSDVEAVGGTFFRGEPMVLRVSRNGGGTANYTLGYTLECPRPQCPQDDQYEPNDGFADAPMIGPRTPIRAVICNSEVDVFRIVAGDGCTIEAEMVFEHVDGNLDLFLLDAQSQIVASSASTSDDEAFAFETEVAGEYLLAVQPFATTGNEYGLRYEVSCTGPTLCPEDDGLEPNDAAADATPLAAAGSLEAVLCEGNVDLFRVLSSAGCTLTSQLEFEHRDGNLDLAILDPALETIVESRSLNDNEAVAAPLGDGTHYVRVSAIDAAEALYRLRTELSCVPPDNLDCDADDPFEPDDELGQARQVQSGVAVEGILCDEAKPDQFTIAAPANCEINGRLEFVHAVGNLGLVLVDSVGQQLAISQTSNSVETIRTQVRSEGMYIFQVVGEASATPYRLTASVSCQPRTLCEDDAAEPNDRPNQRAPLPVGPFHGALCDGDPDYFELVLGPGCEVEAIVTLDHAAGNIDLGIFDGGVPIELSGSGNDRERIVFRTDVARDLGLVVFSEPGVSNDYVLEAFVDCEQAGLNCEVDDPWAPNGGIDTAAPLNAGNVVDGIVCEAAEDFYAIDVPRGCKLLVELATLIEDGNLDLVVYDPDRTRVMSTNDVNDVESLVYPATVTGTHYIAVDPINTASNRYRLGVDIDCVVPGRLVVNELDTAQADADDAEFVEIANPNDAAVSLSRFRLEFVDAGGLAYLTVQLGDVTFALAPGARLVIGTQAVLALVPDRVPKALLPDGSLRSAPGTGARIVGRIAGGNVLVDSVSIGGRTPTLTEGESAAPAEREASDFAAIGRCPDLVDTDENSVDFSVIPPTPGVENDCRAPGMTCPDDDRFEPNDDFESAVGLESTPINAIMCGETADVYRLPSSRGCTIIASVTYPAGEGDLGLVLHAPDGSVLEQSVDPGGRRAVQTVAGDDDDHFARVFPLEAGFISNTYTFESRLECAIDLAEGVVINEIDYTQGGLDPYEYIELINASEGIVPLSSLRVELVEPGGGVYALLDLADVVASLELPESAAPGQMIVIGSTGGLDGGVEARIVRAGLPLARYDAPQGVIFVPIAELGEPMSNAPGAGVRVVDIGSGQPTILDSVAYGGFAGAAAEGTAAPMDPGPLSLARCPDGFDNDDNDFDFVRLLVPTPGNSNLCESDVD